MAAASADYVKAIVALKEGEVAAANKEREKKERDRLAAADEFFLFAVEGPLSSKFLPDLPSEPSTRCAALANWSGTCWSGVAGERRWPPSLSL